MKKLTIATFNCENLFVRFRFQKKLKETTVQNAVKNGFIIERKLFYTIFEKERTLTAQAINETGADIIALQEVENMDTLKKFQLHFLKNKYPFKYLIDGNDPRLIDVAVLSKPNAAALRTHQFDKKGKSRIFSSDFVEATSHFAEGTSDSSGGTSHFAEGTNDSSRGTSGSLEDKTARMNKSWHFLLTLSRPDGTPPCGTTKPAPALMDVVKIGMEEIIQGMPNFK
jgi:hypothetical protein